MARLLKRPVTKTYPIEDPEGNFEVTVNQLTEGDNEALNNYERFLVYEEGELAGVRTTGNPYTDRRKLAYMALGGLTGF